MPDQVKNKSTVAGQDQQRVIEIALPSSISTSDRILRRIATLLFLLVAGMLTVFGYHASFICITVVLAAFLAILFGPLVVKVEKPKPCLKDQPLVHSEVPIGSKARAVAGAIFLAGRCLLAVISIGCDVLIQVSRLSRQRTPLQPWSGSQQRNS